MDLTSLVGLAGVPVVSALTAWVKTTMGNKLPDAYYPSVSIVWGVVLNVVLAVLLFTDWRASVIVGVVTGLAASGLYATAKHNDRISL